MDLIIHRKLTEAFSPDSLEVINESYLHAGHAGDNGTGESHYRVVVECGALAALSRVEAQRRVYAVLQDEMKGAIHAISICIIREK